jgi:hypothetical protein
MAIDEAAVFVFAFGQGLFAKVYPTKILVLKIIVFHGLAHFQ